MVFNFIKDYTSLQTIDVDVMIFNLLLLYFYWDIAKFVINQVIAKLGKGAKRWS